jgi:hypothetical protein
MEPVIANRYEAAGMRKSLTVAAFGPALIGEPGEDKATQGDG